MSLQRRYTVSVARLRFTWDPRKADSNRRKHGVTFEEARTVFYDEGAVLIDEPDHSDDDDDRFVLLGMSGHARVLVVVHCYRTDGDVIRIISARRANRSERA